MSVLTISPVMTIQPIHAKASMASRILHALNCEQNDGRFGQMD